CYLPLLPPSSIYTLSLHDALPIFCTLLLAVDVARTSSEVGVAIPVFPPVAFHARFRAEAAECLAPAPTNHGTGSSAINVLLESRSEEHTSELQSRFDLVCRLLLEK